MVSSVQQSLVRAPSIQLNASRFSNFFLKLEGPGPTFIENPAGSKAGREIRLAVQQTMDGGHKVTFGDRWREAEVSLLGASITEIEGYDSGGTGVLCECNVIEARTPPVVVPPLPVGKVRYPFGETHPEIKLFGTLPLDTKNVTDETKKLYDYWRAEIVKKGLGGQYPEFKPGQVVSEGIGYAMIITAIMAGYDKDAQAHFDDFYNVAVTHPAKKGNGPEGFPIGGSMDEEHLMAWNPQEGQDPLLADAWPATDGDLDICFGLLLAGKQWGSKTGRFNYDEKALLIMDAMKRKMFTPEGVLTSRRTSDLMPSHFRAFAKVSGDSFWTKVNDIGLSHLEELQTKYAPNTGLLPDWFEKAEVANPKPAPPYGGDAGTAEKAGFFWWNVCRIGLRLGQDYVNSGDARIPKITNRMTDFFTEDTKGNLAFVHDGYELDGKIIGTRNPDWHSTSFTGAAIAGALCDAKHQVVIDHSVTEYLKKPARGYYDTELSLLAMFIMGGNWWTV